MFTRRSSTFAATLAFAVGANAALAVGSSVFLNQEVSTGDEARLELKFLDGTQLTLGEKAKTLLTMFSASRSEKPKRQRQ